MYPDSSADLNVETERSIRFFTPAYHPFDNFSAHQIELWGRLFPTAEHAFQWRKFSECAPAVAESILVARSPEAAKKIAAEHRAERRPDWAEARVGVMREILGAKAEQHADVRERLMASGDRTLIEASPSDAFWGVGSDGNGENWVGRILMELRSGLKP
jgi:ribA/ribD-fused uncharacterized protein